MTFSYNLNIPAAGNNPSSDQPLMQTNTNSINSLLNVDHYTFGTGPDGKHLQVQSPFQSVVPTVGVLNESTLYTKLVNRSPATSCEWFVTPDATKTEYQLTQTIEASKTLFATNSIYQVRTGTNPAQNGGWTFLPGGMILQYGIANDSNLNSHFQILFPVPFVTFVGAVTLGAIRNNTDDKTISIFTGSINLTGFQLELSSSDLPTGVSWMAIGI